MDVWLVWDGLADQEWDVQGATVCSWVRELLEQGRIVAIVDVLKAFRILEQEGVVRDYILFGSVAAMVHTRPFFTRDVDIGVVVSGDQEFLCIFNRLAGYGKIQGHSIVIQDTPVDVFPVDISPIIQDAIKYPIRKRVEGVLVKVAPPEHLLLESLRVYRSQDKGRVFILDDVANRSKLRTLFGRLDHDGTLRRRYEALTGNTLEEPKPTSRT